MASVGDLVQEDITEHQSTSDSLSKRNRRVSYRGHELEGDAEADLNDDTMISLYKAEPSWFSRNRSLIRRWRLIALAGIILGWWISATTLHATRHRWIVQTFFAWTFIAIIAFRFIPTSIVTRPIEAVWVPFVQKPFFALPKYVRYGLGWLSLLAVVLGSAFGFKLENVRCWLNFWFSRKANVLFKSAR